MKPLHNIHKIFTRDMVIWTTASVALIGLTKAQIIPSTTTEVVGFLSGALCVWLLVKQNIWNWPLGIINAIAYFFLFQEVVAPRLITEIDNRLQSC